MSDESKASTAGHRRALQAAFGIPRRQEKEGIGGEDVPPTKRSVYFIAVEGHF